LIHVLQYIVFIWSHYFQSDYPTFDWNTKQEGMVLSAFFGHRNSSKLVLISEVFIFEKRYTCHYILHSFLKCWKISQKNSLFSAMKKSINIMEYK